MKTLLAYTLIVLVLAVGCRKKSTEPSSTGTLTGPDLALCACCGGVILQSTDGKNYRIESLPGLTQQELFSLSYPKKIKYNSAINRECGSIIYLDIKEYRFE